MGIEGNQISPDGIATWHAFARYSGKRIAVVFAGDSESTVFKGVAQFGNDRTLGPSLRICSGLSRSQQKMDIIIAEGSWGGWIVPGTLYDCDYCFIPTQGAI